MRREIYGSNLRKLLFLTMLAALAAAMYMTVEVNFENARLLRYALKIRAPKLIAMLIAASAIGGASIVFQSIINNTIVTPCLLGMNSLPIHRWCLRQVPAVSLQPMPTPRLPQIWF